MPPQAFEHPSVHVCDAVDSRRATHLRQALASIGFITNRTLLESDCVIVCVDGQRWSVRPLDSPLMRDLALLRDDVRLIPLVITPDRFPSDLPDVLWRRQALVVRNTCEPHCLVRLAGLIGAPRGIVRNANSDLVFISYRATDRGDAEAVEQALRAAGARTWLDQRDLEPGSLWRSAIDASLDRASAVAVCVGRGGLSSWQSQEIQRVQSRRDGGAGCRVTYLLLPTFDDELQSHDLLEPSIRWRPGLSLPDLLPRTQEVAP